MEALTADAAGERLFLVDALPVNQARARSVPPPTQHSDHCTAGGEGTETTKVTLRHFYHYLSLHATFLSLHAALCYYVSPCVAVRRYMSP